MVATLNELSILVYSNNNCKVMCTRLPKYINCKLFFYSYNSNTFGNQIYNIMNYKNSTLVHSSVIYTRHPSRYNFFMYIIFERRLFIWTFYLMKLNFIW